MAFNEDKTIYEQISEMIEQNILRGDLKEEERAPSTNEFARVYQINPATARKGLNLLVDSGVLYKKRGLGMFVSSGAKQILLEKRQKLFYEEQLPQLLEEAKRLQISMDELVEQMRKVKL